MRARGLVMTVAVLLAAAATASVFLYIRGVREEARTGGSRATVVVASRPIAAGARLDDLVAEGAFTTTTVPRDALVPGAVRSISALQGAEAASAIVAGEQIPAARLRTRSETGGGVLGIPPGLEAVTVPLGLSRAAGGALRQGDHVSLLATFTDLDRVQRSGRVSDLTVTLVPDVEVLRVEGNPGEGVSSTVGASQLDATVLVTLALEPGDTQRVVFAQERGSLWLTLLPPNQEGTDERPVSYREVTG